MLRANPQCELTGFYEGYYSVESGEKAGESLLAMPRRELPDAVVSANDQMAIGVVKALARAGVRVPEDVAVVGFDDIFPGSLCDPPLTTVHQPMRMLGERACARLLERIANPGLRPATELLPTELVLRSSCGCPPGTVIRQPVPTLKVPRSELTAAAPPSPTEPPARSPPGPASSEGIGAAMPFILRRLVFYLVAAWVALTINFFIPRAMPGNAVQSVMAKFPNLQPSAYKALEALLGVGHPGSLWHQYVSYLDDIFHFNFGTDVSQYPASVSSLLAQTLPWTITLVGVATVIAFLIGTALGIVAGWRHGGTLDRVLPGLMFLQAIPYFFFALILVELLAIKVHVFPTGQGYDNGLIPGWHWDFISSALYHSALPALTIVLTSIAGWMLQMRNVMITTSGEDYVIAAQAKGLPSRRVIYTYAARNALLPQLQGFGLAVGFVVSGAIVMEIVFGYPGIGLLLLNAVTSNDYPLMQAIFLVITFAVLLANLVVDMIIVVADPRARRMEATS